MPITVRYFAAARDLAGCGEEALPLPSQALSLAEVEGALAARHPAIGPHLARMRFAVNGEFADRDSVVHEGDEVVVLPPVAGGSPVMMSAVLDEPLSVDAALRAVSQPSAGGICVFVGTVRDHADGKPVVRLTYEAYRELAEKETRRILEAICSEQVGVRLAVAHRVGTLAVGDLAVVVAASAAHRDQAFAACRAAIDRIKETVPIWKQEWGPNGDPHWVNFDP